MLLFSAFLIHWSAMLDRLWKVRFREHLKYVWNVSVYCVITNHRRDLHTTETTGNERFPIGHGTNYFRFGLTFSLFYKKTIAFPCYLLTVCYDSEEYRFERFLNKLQSRCAGSTHVTVWRANFQSFCNDRNR